jgi:hypothetical protein
MSDESNRMPITGHPVNTNIINLLQQLEVADSVALTLAWLDEMPSDPTIAHYAPNDVRLLVALEQAYAATERALERLAAIQNGAVIESGVD